MEINGRMCFLFVFMPELRISEIILLAADVEAERETCKLCSGEQWA